MRELIIDGKRIADDTDCYVIAEIGHNHQGDLLKAKELFKAARDAGVDAVKLQKRNNRALFTRAMYDRPYDNENSFGSTYGAHREALEFGRAEYESLKEYAAVIGVTFFATAFDFPSVEFLASLDMPAYKIASGDLRNIPLLRRVAEQQKPIILSTGGGTIEDIYRAVTAITAINPNLAILQCTATYPTQPAQMNLNVIGSLRAEFPAIPVGLSDHYNGIAMSVAAYVLGARIIEKHFTMNHTWRGTDHALSLEPIGMGKMVRDLRRTREALGDGLKVPLPEEASALQKMGKSLVAARNLPAGHVLEPGDISIKSPGGGIPAYEMDRVIGQRLTEALAEDDFVPAALLTGIHSAPLAAR